jgi:hypothetical protein
VGRASESRAQVATTAPGPDTLAMGGIAAAVAFLLLECSAKYTCIFQIRVDALSGADLVFTWNLSFKFWHHID